MSSWFDIIDEPPVQWSQGEEYPLFNRVSIETSSYCNRSCSFCPISKGRRPRQIMMSDELFDSVVAQLAQLGFDGVVQLFLLNEPTLDRQLLARAYKLYKEIPGAVSIYVSTNCDTLLKLPLPEAIDRLYDYWLNGINVINLNVYDAGPEQLQKITELRDHACWVHEDVIVPIESGKYRKHTQNKLHLAITDMRPERVIGDVSLVNMLHERVESASPEITAPQVACARPHRHLVIRYDGKIPLCCAVDPTAQDLVIAGDLNEQSIKQVWNGEVLTKYRWHLQQARRDLPMCSQCTHRMAYSHVVRKVQYVEV